MCSSQGDRIRTLFSCASDDVIVIAPFIKTKALQSLLKAVPANLPLRCVTRWRSREVAAGVSDPEIIYLLEDRGYSDLYLADNLHAKLYIAGTDCLVGSANVTQTALGDVEDSNIELLVHANIDDPWVDATLKQIWAVGRLATEEMARSIMKIAGSLLDFTGAAPESDIEDVWFPRSVRAADAYRVYAQPVQEFTKTADGVLLTDIARGNLQPGLGTKEFGQEVRRLLKDMTVARQFLEEGETGILKFAEVRDYFQEIASDDFSAFDLWQAFVAWMLEFFPDKVVSKQIVEVALRRGRLLS